MSQNNYVIPGDVITSGQFIAEQNVVQNGDDFLSTTIGISQVIDNAVSVMPLTGFYIPQPDDLIVGKVVSHSSLSWEIDINSYRMGILPATDIFGRNYSAARDDMSSKFVTGDVILARIADANESRDPILTVQGDSELGKNESGQLIKVSISKITNLLKNDDSILSDIMQNTNSTITVGQNGVLLVQCENESDFKKISEISNLIEIRSHHSDLPKRIRDFMGAN